MKKGMIKKTEAKAERITCVRCIRSRLLEYYEGSLTDPLIAECRGERFVARYHSCKDAEAARGKKEVTRINKRKKADGLLEEDIRKADGVAAVQEGMLRAPFHPLSA